MKLIVNVLVSALAIFITAYLLKGADVDNFWTAIIVAIVLGLVNILIKPIIVILTLPVNILTLGLFSLVINALMIMLTSSLVAGFTVANFWWAILFGVVLSVVNSVLQIFT